MKEALLASLIHRLRTPLAVIASDLEYIERKYPDLEADRTQRNVKKITDLLRFIESLSNASSCEAFQKILSHEAHWSCTPCLDLQFSCTAPKECFAGGFEGDYLEALVSSKGGKITVETLENGTKEVRIKVDFR